MRGVDVTVAGRAERRPRRLEGRSVLAAIAGEAVLDLAGAELVGEPTVVAVAVAGATIVRVPRGVTVHVVGRAVAGAATVRRLERGAAPGGPRLRVVAVAVAGAVVVTGAEPVTES